MISRKMVDFPHQNSFFLLGPRQTGKTTAILNFLKNRKHWHVNLLLSKNFMRYNKEPDLFRQDALYEINENEVSCVFLDEVQKIPILLDEVHQLIEDNKKVQFILSGSSARKLKKESVNLLAGRAFLRHLYPILQCEVGKEFKLEAALQIGTLPFTFTDIKSDTIEKLNAYVETYLKEEIIQESIIRNTGDFHRFLEVAAQHSAELINFENISRESAVKSKTVKSHYQILEDTLIGFQLPSWDQSVRKQLALHPKFYFFDCGVLNAITGMLSGKLAPELRGKLFEQFLINEIRAYISYKRLPYKLHFWRTKAGNEVDLLISKSSKPIAAIEIKATKKISRKHLSGLFSLSDEFDIKQKFLVCEDDQPRIIEGIQIVPWQTFLNLKLKNIS